MAQAQLPQKEVSFNFNYFNHRILKNLLSRELTSWQSKAGLTLSVAQANQMPTSPASRSLEKRADGNRDVSWGDLHLDVRSEPILLIVLDGEADIRVGWGKANGKHSNNSPLRLKKEVHVYALPCRNCLVIPPGIGHSDGSTPHWERGNPEEAHSQILWLQILPAGVIAYMCMSEGNRHTHTSAIFVGDPQLWSQMQFFFDWSDRISEVDDLLYSFLKSVILCIDRNISSGQMIGSVAACNDIDALHMHHQRASDGGANDLQTQALERAIFYIDSHLTDALTPQLIARHACVSLAQLKRIFRSHLNTPVMKYVADRRLKEAEDMIAGTNMSIEAIGENCGFSQRTYFSRVFKEYSGYSPLAFRQKAIENALSQDSANSKMSRRDTS